MPKVLVTDYAWPTLTVEQQVFDPLGIQLVVAKSGEEAELVQIAPAADAILTCWKKVTPAVLDAASRCLIVGRYGIGLDNIAVDHATKLGILVTNVPDFCLNEVAEHTLALLLACARRIVQLSAATRTGVWNLNAGLPMARVNGRTLGLIGYGNIAQALVPKAVGLGLKVIAYTPRLRREALSPSLQTTDSLDAVLREADYVSLHLPLTDRTERLVDHAFLRKMKPTAYLINTSRGRLVDENALDEALRAGWIAGAGLDVLAEEPPLPSHRLLGFENVIVTPHASFYSEKAVEDLARKAAQQVTQVLARTLPSNIVNPQVLAQPNCRFRR